MVAADASAAMVDDQDVVTGPVPLTPAQHRFLSERATPDPHHWNLSTIIQADRLSPTALRDALEAVVRHHDALRLRLWQEDGRWNQEIAAPPETVAFESTTCRRRRGTSGRRRSSASARDCREAMTSGAGCC